MQGNLHVRFGGRPMVSSHREEVSLVTELAVHPTIVPIEKGNIVLVPIGRTLYQGNGMSTEVT